jgi:hypothetical protein
MPILSNDTQDLIKSALGTPAAQQELINAVLDIQSSQLTAGSVTSAAIAANAVDYAQLATDVLQSATTTLTAAELLAIHTTPIAVLPAPGSGLVNVVESAYATLAFGTTAFTAADPLTLNYTNGSGVAVGSFSTSFCTSSANAAAFSIMEAGTCAPNVAIVASSAANFGNSGDSVIKVRVFYRTLPAQM